MSFSDHKIQTFTNKIASLPDQPNMLPDELKAYFDSSPEELREALNDLCDALGDTAAAANLGFAQTAGVPASTVQGAIENVQAQVSAAVVGSIPSGSITEDKLSQDVRDRLDENEAAITAEVSTRASADAAEAGSRASADTNLQNQINTHTTQIAQKCEIYTGTYTGDESAERTISLGFSPKAVLVLSQTGRVAYRHNGTTYVYGGLALQGLPSQEMYESVAYKAVEIVTNGFKVFSSSLPDYAGYINTNLEDEVYFYIAFK